MSVTSSVPLATTKTLRMPPPGVDARRTSRPADAADDLAVEQRAAGDRHGRRRAVLGAQVDAANVGVGRVAAGASARLAGAGRGAAQPARELGELAVERVEAKVAVLGPEGDLLARRWSWRTRLPRCPAWLVTLEFALTLVKTVPGRRPPDPGAVVAEAAVAGVVEDLQALVAAAELARGVVVGAVLPAGLGERRHRAALGDRVDARPAARPAAPGRRAGRCARTRRRTGARGCAWRAFSCSKPNWAGAGVGGLVVPDSGLGVGWRVRARVRAVTLGAGAGAGGAGGAGGRGWSRRLTTGAGACGVRRWAAGSGLGRAASASHAAAAIGAAARAGALGSTASTSVRGSVRAAARRRRRRRGRRPRPTSAGNGCGGFGFSERAQRGR